VHAVLPNRHSLNVQHGRDLRKGEIMSCTKLFIALMALGLGLSGISQTVAAPITAFVPAKTANPDIEQISFRRNCPSWAAGCRAQQEHMRRQAVLDRLHPRSALHSPSFPPCAKDWMGNCRGGGTGPGYGGRP
jgi:hypothetical protein